MMGTPSFHSTPPPVLPSNLISITILVIAAMLHPFTTRNNQRNLDKRRSFHIPSSLVLKKTNFFLNSSHIVQTYFAILQIFMIKCGQVTCIQIEKTWQTLKTPLKRSQQGNEKMDIRNIGVRSVTRVTELNRKNIATAQFASKAYPFPVLPVRGNLVGGILQPGT